ncbi:MAG: hypothetical protein LBS75_00925 [Synergistaceae bacterium]|jgi:hypothetical protein|nr:hypothetical protein [Synergistaceae bacterium]
MDEPNKISEQTERSGHKSAAREKTDVLNEQIGFLQNTIAVQKDRIAEYYWSKYSESGFCDKELQTEFVTIGECLEKIADLESDIQIILDGNNQLLQQPVMIPDIMDHQAASFDFPV